MERGTRRTFLAAAGTLGTASVAGCSGLLGGSDDRRWSAHVGRILYGSPLVVGDTLYTYGRNESDEYRIWCYEAETGEQRWSRPASSRTTVVVEDGVPYAAGPTDPRGVRVLRLDPETGDERRSLEFFDIMAADNLTTNLRSDGPSVVASFDSVATFDLETGDDRRTFSVDKPVLDVESVGNSVCVLVTLNLFGYSDGSREWSREVWPPGYDPPRVLGGSLGNNVVTVATGGVAIHDSATGVRRWTRGFGSQEAVRFARTVEDGEDDVLCVVTSGESVVGDETYGKIYCLRRDGSVLWDLRTDRTIDGFAFGGGIDRLYLQVDGPDLVRFDLAGESGRFEEVWRMSVRPDTPLSIGARGTDVYLTSPSGVLRAYDSSGADEN